MQLRNVFKNASLSMAPAALALTPTPAEADTLTDFPETNQLDHRNSMVASWTETVLDIMQPENIGPLDRDVFLFDIENDMIAIDSNVFGGTEYAQRVEEMANYYVTEYGADPFDVMSVIKASHDVGVDATFIMKTVEIECSWDFNRYPSTSSARGPGILQGTWEHLASKHGDEWGFTAETDRRDPYWGSLGAALYVKDSVSYIRTYYQGEEITPVMIRNSFFWGDGGNRRVNRYLARNPNAPARKLLAAEYRANPTIVRGTIEETVNRVGAKVSDLEVYEETPPVITFEVAQRENILFNRILMASLSQALLPIAAIDTNTGVEMPSVEVSSVQYSGLIFPNRN